jgi:predicted aspartyl protease
MRLTAILALVVTTPLSAHLAWGENFNTHVAMHEKSAATFYVPGEIEGYGHVELMVDTGSGYMTINQRTLDVLKRAGRVRYVKQLQGILADGSVLTVPVYSIGRMSIGDNCWLRDVEAAVFAGKSRQILGLSALRKAAPFIFSVDPPTLALSKCENQPTAATEPSSSSGALTASSR